MTRELLDWRRSTSPITGNCTRIWNSSGSASRSTNKPEEPVSIYRQQPFMINPHLLTISTPIKPTPLPLCNTSTIAMIKITTLHINNHHPPTTTIISKALPIVTTSNQKRGSRRGALGKTPTAGLSPKGKGSRSSLLMKFIRR